VPAAAAAAIAPAHGPDAVAVLHRPRWSNEELFALRRLFRTSSKSTDRVPGACLRAGFHRTTSMITPTRTRTRAGRSHEPRPSGSGELLRDCAQGQVRFLYICHHDLTRGHDGQEVATRSGRWTSCITGFIQPGDAGWRTSNCRRPCTPRRKGPSRTSQGRVQRHTRLSLRWASLCPIVSILASLASALGLKPGAGRAADVFRRSAKTWAPFAGMTSKRWEARGNWLK